MTPISNSSPKVNTTNVEADFKRDSKIPNGADPAGDYVLDLALELIRDHWQNGRQIVPLIGAGISVESGFPAINALSDHLLSLHLLQKKNLNWASQPPMPAYDLQRDGWISSSRLSERISPTKRDEILKEFLKGEFDYNLFWTLKDGDNTSSLAHLKQSTHQTIDESAGSELTNFANTLRLDWLVLMEKIAGHRPELVDVIFDALGAHASPGATHNLLTHCVEWFNIRLLLTTNFDSLTEESLKAEGLDPYGYDIHMRAEPPPKVLVERHLSVIKLHGSHYGLRADRSVEQPLDRGHLSTLLDYLNDDVVLLCLGYGGNENRITGFIEAVLKNKPHSRMIRIDPLSPSAGHFFGTLAKTYNEKEHRDDPRVINLYYPPSTGLFLLHLYQYVANRMPNTRNHYPSSPHTAAPHKNYPTLGCDAYWTWSDTDYKQPKNSEPKNSPVTKTATAENPATRAESNTTDSATVTETVASAGSMTSTSTGVEAESEAIEGSPVPTDAVAIGTGGALVPASPSDTPAKGSSQGYKSLRTQTRDKANYAEDIHTDIKGGKRWIVVTGEEGCGSSQVLGQLYEKLFRSHQISWCDLDEVTSVGGVMGWLHDFVNVRQPELPSTPLPFELPLFEKPQAPPADKKGQGYLQWQEVRDLARAARHLWSHLTREKIVIILDSLSCALEVFDVDEHKTRGLQKRNEGASGTGEEATRATREAARLLLLVAILMRYAQKEEGTKEGQCVLVVGTHTVKRSCNRRLRHYYLTQRDEDSLKVQLEENWYKSEADEIWKNIDYLLGSPPKDHGYFLKGAIITSSKEVNDTDSHKREPEPAKDGTDVSRPAQDANKKADDIKTGIDEADEAKDNFNTNNEGTNASEIRANYDERGYPARGWLWELAAIPTEWRLDKQAEFAAEKDEKNKKELELQKRRLSEKLKEELDRHLDTFLEECAWCNRPRSWRQLIQLPSVKEFGKAIRDEEHIIHRALAQLERRETPAPQYLSSLKNFDERSRALRILINAAVRHRKLYLQAGGFYYMDDRVRYVQRAKSAVAPAAVAPAAVAPAAVAPAAVAPAAVAPAAVAPAAKEPDGRTTPVVAPEIQQTHQRMAAFFERNYNQSGDVNALSHYSWHMFRVIQHEEDRVVAMEQGASAVTYWLTMESFVSRMLENSLPARGCLYAYEHCFLLLQLWDKLESIEEKARRDKKYHVLQHEKKSRDLRTRLLNTICEIYEDNLDDKSEEKVAEKLKELSGNIELAIL